MNALALHSKNCTSVPLLKLRVIPLFLTKPAGILTLCHRQAWSLQTHVHRAARKYSQSQTAQLHILSGTAEDERKLEANYRCTSVKDPRRKPHIYISHITINGHL
ncbi:unnamed protein product [Ixodes pacificus]